VPLKDYWAKRDFTKTPEPRGGVETRRAPGALFFCVQKHLASQLHYDFRLEYEGVLLSWAVPKGPSLDPTVKRLAMQVEDHPIDYGTFEGVIPSGYGAGIVMLWDRGTWEPESADVEAALQKGDLKFRLNGYKLKGSWVLVRTRANQGRGWLLIKHRDEWSGDLDIAAFAPLSVKSAGDLADILAEDQPDLWTSNKPARDGATGQLLAKVIEQAAALKREREAEAAAPRRPKTPRPRGRTAGAGTSRARKKTAASPGARPAKTAVSKSTRAARKK
jgi:bifunctional non-homologous end joining protein LigD